MKDEDKKSVLSTQNVGVNQSQMSGVSSSIKGSVYSQKESLLSPKMDSSEPPTSLVHPINLLIQKISYLLTCIYKQRLEDLGISVDKVDFETEISDFGSLQKIGKSAIEDI